MSSPFHQRSDTPMSVLASPLCGSACALRGRRSAPGLPSGESIRVGHDILAPLLRSGACADHLSDSSNRPIPLLSSTHAGITPLSYRPPAATASPPLLLAVPSQPLGRRSPIQTPQGDTTDPHRRWQEAVDYFRIGSTLQIWPNESHAAVGGIYDTPFDHGIGADDFLRPAFNRAFTSIVFHIVFGKWAIRGHRPLADVRTQFLNLLAKAKNLSQRVIVTEHNKDSDSFPQLRERLPEAREILDMIRCHFQSSSITFSGGNGGEFRNIIVVCDKSGGETHRH